MYNSTAWAMLLVCLGLSGSGGSAEPMPLWARLIIISGLCVLMVLLAFETYDLSKYFINDYKQNKRKKELLRRKRELQKK